MRTIVLSIALLTSCQPQENRVVPTNVKTTLEKPAKIKETVKPGNATPAKEKSVAIVEKEISENAEAKQVKAKICTQAITTAEKKTASDGPGSKENTGIEDLPVDNGGASNYSEGYIPFIKQYW